LFSHKALKAKLNTYCLHFLKLYCSKLTLILIDSIDNHYKKEL